MLAREERLLVLQRFNPNKETLRTRIQEKACCCRFVQDSVLMFCHVIHQLIARTTEERKRTRTSRITHDSRHQYKHQNQNHQQKNVIFCRANCGAFAHESDIQIQQDETKSNYSMPQLSRQAAAARSIDVKPAKLAHKI